MDASRRVDDKRSSPGAPSPVTTLDLAPRGVDRRVIAVLVAIPLVGFALPALFGHPIVTGDNQIQNLPLRALSGEDLRHGHLPLWNPYIWSGSPLLGGLNAGSLYPFTWLFAVLPVLTAWTVNLVVVYVTAAVGMYAFLRQQALRRFSCGFAAATFAFAGSMSAQVVHLGIVQGTSWIPWMLLVEQRLARQLLPQTPGPPASSAVSAVSASAAPPPALWRRVTLLGLLGGLVLLTGEPRGMADAAVVVGLAALWHLLTGRATLRARAALLSAFVSSAFLAAAVGAVQLLPGWSFIADSQRAQSTVQFFGSGSLPVRWSLLMLIPDLMGGTGVLHQPSFFAHYNLPEVTGYVGVVPLMAAAGLLARSFGRRRHPQARRWTAWFALVVVGMLLTYGTYTPLGPYLARLPFYGALRLQSRNIVIAGLGLTVLLAYWLDIVLDGPTPADHDRRRLITLATAAPAAAVIVTGAVALAWPSRLEQWLGVTPKMAHLGRSLTPWFIATVVVAVLAGTVGLGWHRLRRPTRAWAVGAVIAVDLVLFTFSAVSELNLHFTTDQLPTALSAAPVAPGTRFAIVDPENDALVQMSVLGENDLNTLVHRVSVQGYGSLTDNGYQSATGTRTHNTLSPCALASGAFVPLDLGTLMTLTNDLIQRTATGAPAAQVAAQDTCAGVVAPGATRRVWWFGRVLSVRSASLAFAPTAGAPSPAGLRVGVLSDTGATRWTTATITPAADDDLDISFSTPVLGSGLVLCGPGSQATTDATTVTTASGFHWSMDGNLQSALRDASFHFAGYRSGVALFRTSVTRPTVWIQSRRSSTPTPPATQELGAVRRVSTTMWGDETDAVTARRPATLVRSEAYATGWTAAARDTTTGRTRPLDVVRIGLIEGVRIPAGSYTVTWTYQPASAGDGLIGSLAGAVVVLAAAASWGWGRRRRRQPAP